MTREEMIDHMLNFVESTPDDSSEYHKMDMLLSRMERLGMLPPIVEKLWMGSVIDEWSSWEVTDD